MGDFLSLGREMKLARGERVDSIDACFQDLLEQEKMVRENPLAAGYGLPGIFIQNGISLQNPNLQTQTQGPSLIRQNSMLSAGVNLNSNGHNSRGLNSSGQNSSGQNLNGQNSNGQNLTHNQNSINQNLSNNQFQTLGLKSPSLNVQNMGLGNFSKGSSQNSINQTSLSKNTENSNLQSFMEQIMLGSKFKPKMVLEVESSESSRKASLETEEKYLNGDQQLQEVKQNGKDKLEDLDNRPLDNQHLDNQQLDNPQSDNPQSDHQHSND